MSFYLIFFLVFQEKSQNSEKVIYLKKISINIIFLRKKIKSHFWGKTFTQKLFSWENKTIFFMVTSRVKSHIWKIKEFGEKSWSFLFIFMQNKNKMMCECVCVTLVNLKSLFKHLKSNSSCVLFVNGVWRLWRGSDLVVKLISATLTNSAHRPFSKPLLSLSSKPPDSIKNTLIGVFGS